MEDYRKLKARHARQKDIGEAIDEGARKLIRRFGWENPLRELSPKDTPEPDNPPSDEAEQTRRDGVLKQVREVRHEPEERRFALFTRMGAGG